MGHALVIPSQIVLTQGVTFEDCEQDIAALKKVAFYVIGQRLQRIKNHPQWYEPTYGSWENYCRQRWGWSVKYAYELMRAAKIYYDLKEHSGMPELPQNARQAYGLSKLNGSEQRIAAWETAVAYARAEAEATASEEPATSYRHVKRAVEVTQNTNNAEVTTGDRSPLTQRYGAAFTSSSPEWYTPRNIIDRVLLTLDQIDLDPCSNSHSKPTVPAANVFTKREDGLTQPWRGRIYMNPPYGRSIGDWLGKLVKDYEDGEVTEAIALTPARTDTVWFRRLRSYPRCFIWGRLRFSDANSAPFPSMAVYLGSRLNRFVKAFSDIGDVYALVS